MGYDRLGFWFFYFSSVMRNVSVVGLADRLWFVAWPIGISDRIFRTWQFLDNRSNQPLNLPRGHTYKAPLLIVKDLFHTLGRDIVKGQFSTNKQEREGTTNVAAIRKTIVAFADPAQWFDGIAPDSSRWWFSSGKEKRQKRKGQKARKEIRKYKPRLPKRKKRRKGEKTPPREKSQPILNNT